MLSIFFVYCLAVAVYFGSVAALDPGFDPHQIVPYAPMLSFFVVLPMVWRVIWAYHYRLKNGYPAAPHYAHGGIDEWVYCLIMSFETDFRNFFPPEWIETARFRWKDFFHEFWSFFAKVAVVASLAAWFIAASAVGYYDMPVPPALALVIPTSVTVLLLVLSRKAFFPDYENEIEVLDALRDSSFLEWCASNWYRLNGTDGGTVLRMRRMHVDYVNGESEEFMEWLEKRGGENADEEEIFALYEEFQKERKG